MKSMDFYLYLRSGYPWPGQRTDNGEPCLDLKPWMLSTDGNLGATPPIGS